MISLLYTRGRKLVALFIGRATTRCTSFNCTVVGVRVGEQGSSIQCLSIGQRGLGLLDALKSWAEFGEEWSISRYGGRSGPFWSAEKWGHHNCGFWWPVQSVWWWLLHVWWDVSGWSDDPSSSKYQSVCWSVCCRLEAEDQSFCSLARAMACWMGRACWMGKNTYPKPWR